MGVNVPARLVVRDTSYAIAIRNISRFGAYVIDLPDLERGTSVTLQIVSQSPRTLEVKATVVYWIDEKAAARLGNVAGAGLRFDVPIDEQDTQFGAALTCLLVEQTLAHTAPPRRRAEKPTPRMLETQQTALCSAMNTEGFDARGRLSFAGLVAVIRVPEVLMTLARLRVCGRLELTCGGLVANIDLQDGDIVGVRSSMELGDPRSVISMLLSSRTGTFRLISQAPHVHPATRMNVAHLLIEHVQRKSMLPEIPPPPPSS
jgi:hypothetical protein